MNNLRQIIAIDNANKRRLCTLFGNIPEASGIYIFTRQDENGERFSYVGQAKRLLSRIAQHLRGYKQHIDLSLLKRKLYTTGNPYGWKVVWEEVSESRLDEIERGYIEMCKYEGFTSLNKLDGGQGAGRKKIAETKPAKTYRNGLAQGYKNAQRLVAGLFSKNLRAEIQGKDGVLKQRALQKFNKFLGVENDTIEQS